MIKHQFSSLFFATLGAVALPAVAAPTFHLVVPLPMRSQAPAPDIRVELHPASLPPAVAGQAYSQPLTDFLQITGDPSLDHSLVAWVVTGGSLPSGLALHQGSLMGTPNQAGESVFEISATYKAKTGVQTYRIQVGLTVLLASASLPEGVVGQAYAGFDFKPLLSSPESGFAPSAATWAVKAGSTLPPGLTLDPSTGLLSGTPTAPYSGAVDVVASYKGATGEQSYAVITRQITVSLTSATLPKATYAAPYQYDLKAHLSVAGDPAYQTGSATFTATSLPAGLSLNAAGLLSGSPLIAGAAVPVQVSASYRGVAAQGTFTVPVDLPIKNFSGVRMWADGTYAQSCKSYRNPTDSWRTYSGDTGNGVYRIQPPGAAPADTYCDMVSDGGGWTMVTSRSGRTAILQAEGTPTPTSNNYLPADVAKKLAGISSEIWLNDLAASKWVKTTAPLILDNLRAGRLLNYGADPTLWTRNNVPLAELQFSYSPAFEGAGYPSNHYWASNNQGGLHHGSHWSCWVYSNCVNLTNGAGTGYSDQIVTFVR